MRGTARGQVQSHYRVMVRTVKKIAVYYWKKCESSISVCVCVSYVRGIFQHVDGSLPKNGQCMSFFSLLCTAHSCNVSPYVVEGE